MKAQKPFDPTRRIPQQAVRVGKFEKYMDGFRGEMGMKMARTLNEYHREFVLRLEERIAYLELPFWKRWWVQAGRLWERVRRKNLTARLGSAG